MWAQLSDEQKGTYGEEYFEKAIRSLEKYTTNVTISIPILCTEISGDKC